MDIQELRREAQTMQPQLTADRRRLHRNPEAGAVLPETVSYVKERLTEMGYHPQELGGGLRWVEIYDANRDQIQDPDRIQAGMELELPA